MNSTYLKAKNSILVVIFSVLLILIGYIVFNFLNSENENKQSDTLDTLDTLDTQRTEGVVNPQEHVLVGTNSLPGLSKNDAYKNGYAAMQAGDYEAAIEYFREASSIAVSVNEKMLSEYMLASSLRFTREAPNVLESIRRYKLLIGNPEYKNSGFRIKSDAVNKLVSMYVSTPSPENFNEIFFGEPQIFRNIVADVDAKPNQIDSSMLNLLKFSSDILPTAESELKIANALFNHNKDLYLKFFTACKKVVNLEENGCQPDIDALLTSDEKELFYEIEREFKQRRAAADTDIEFLRTVQTKGTIARLGSIRSRVFHKAMYLGFTTPSEVQDALEQAVIDTEFADGGEEIVTARFEKAIFLSLLRPNPTAEQVEEIAQLIKPLYEPSGTLSHLKPWYLGTLTTAYRELSGEEYSIQHEMAMRGPLAIAKVEPEFKNFLVEEVGWDFEGIAISRIMNPDR